MGYPDWVPPEFSNKFVTTDDRVEKFGSSLDVELKVSEGMSRLLEDNESCEKAWRHIKKLKIDEYDLFYVLISGAYRQALEKEVTKKIISRNKRIAKLSEKLAALIKQDISLDYLPVLEKSGMNTLDETNYAEIAQHVFWFSRADDLVGELKKHSNFRYSAILSRLAKISHSACNFNKDNIKGSSPTPIFHRKLAYAFYEITGNFQQVTIELITKIIFDNDAITSSRVSRDLKEMKKVHF